MSINDDHVMTSLELDQRLGKDTGIIRSQWKVADKTTAGGMKNHFDSIDQVNNLREIQVGSWWGNGNHRELTYIDCVNPNQGP